MFYVILFIHFDLCKLWIRCRSTIRSCGTRQGTTLFLSSLILFISIYFNCASGACPQQGVAAPDRAPLFFNLFQFIIIYWNFASGACPQQGYAAPDMAPGYLMSLLLVILVYLNCVSGAAHSKESCCVVLIVLLYSAIVILYSPVV